MNTKKKECRRAFIPRATTAPEKHFHFLRVTVSYNDGKQHVTHCINIVHVLPLAHRTRPRTIYIIATLQQQQQRAAKDRTRHHLCLF